MKTDIIPITDDALFASRIRPFIVDMMQVLEAYDNLRPADHPYRFHMHSKRVAENTRLMARHLGMDDAQAETLYWAAWPHDIGKMRLPVDLWDSEGKPSKQVKAARRSHTLTGVRMIEENFSDVLDHPFIALLCQIMLRHHEAMDGSGYLGLKGDDLSLPVQIVAAVDAFDGWSCWRPHYGERDISPEGVIKRMRKEKKGQFKPDMVDALEALVKKEALCLPSQR